MAQDRVAGGVAVRVVAALEVVEVDEDERQRPPVAGRAGQLLLHPGEDGLAVGDAGQRVDGRLDPGLGDAGRELLERAAETLVADAPRLGGEHGVVRVGAREPLRDPGDAPVLEGDDEQRRSPPRRSAPR